MRFLALTIILLLLAVPTAIALPTGATGITVVETGRRELSGGNSTTVQAQAGNVTQINIGGLSITRSWQGYYGNVTGNIVLADADNNSFYSWGNATSVSGEVFASRNDSVDWTTINCSNTTIISQEETTLGHSASDGDSVTNTYYATSHPDFLVGARNMTGCPTTYAYVNGASQTTDYAQILLADNSQNVVYTTIIEDSATGFDGDSWDFQLLVGENGQPGNEETTTYYFYTELS